MVKYLVLSVSLLSLRYAEGMDSAATWFPWNNVKEACERELKKHPDVNAVAEYDERNLPIRLCIVISAKSETAIATYEAVCAQITNAHVRPEKEEILYRYPWSQGDEILSGIRVGKIIYRTEWDGLQTIKATIASNYNTLIDIRK